MDIVICVPTNEDYWTNNSDDVASGWVARVIDAYEDRVVEAVEAAYPDANVESRRVPETFSRNNQTTVETDDIDQERDVLERIRDIESTLDYSDVK